MSIDFLSKEESQSSETKFAQMEADDYIAKIVEIDSNAKRQKYDSYKRRGRVEVQNLPPEEIDNITKVVMLIYGLKSGDVMRDVDGKNVEPLVRRAYKDVLPFTGFNRKSGAPTDFRCLFGFALRQDPMKPFQVPSINDLVGKYIGIEIAMNSKGNNTVKGFKKVPDSFKPDAAIEASAMQKYAEQKAKRQDESGDTYTPSLSSTDDASIEDRPF